MSYFGGATGPVEGSIHVVKEADLARFGIVDGIDIAPVLGTRLNVNVVRLAPNAIAAVHAHDEEQIGVVIAGTLTFTDGRRSFALEAGDCYRAPAGAPHGATAGPDGATVIDAFAPPREGIRELLES